MATIFPSALARARIGRAEVCEQLLEPGTVLAPHRHRNAYVCLLLAGAHWERTRSGERFCAPGVVATHPAGTTHRNRVGPTGAHCLNISAPAEWTAPLLEEVEHSRYSMSVGGLGQVAARVRGIVRSGGSEDGLLDTVRALLAVGSCPPRRASDPRRPPAFLSRLRDQILADPFTVWTLDDLASGFGRHPNHVARLVKRHWGISLGAFVRRARLSATCQRLLRTKATIAEIAQEAGFYDQSHFTNWFVRMTGESPGRYRALFRV